MAPTPFHLLFPDLAVAKSLDATGRGLRGSKHLYFYDAYCPVPACTCRGALVRVTNSGGRTLAMIDVDLCAQLDDSWLARLASETPVGADTQRVLELFLSEVLTEDYLELLKLHYRQVKQAVRSSPIPYDPELSDELPPRQASQRPGRNAPCWCGSGRKYKRCCLAQDRKEGLSDDLRTSPLENWAIQAGRAWIERGGQLEYDEYDDKYDDDDEYDDDDDDDEYDDDDDDLDDPDLLAAWATVCAEEGPAGPLSGDGPLPEDFGPGTIRATPTEMLVARLAAEGIDLQPDSLGRLAEAHAAEGRWAAWEVAGELLPDLDDLAPPVMRLLAATAVVLWERHLPGTPCFEVVDELIQGGIDRFFQQDLEIAYERWARAWELLQPRLRDHHSLIDVEEVQQPLGQPLLKRRSWLPPQPAGQESQPRRLQVEVDQKHAAALQRQELPHVEERHRPADAAAEGVEGRPARRAPEQLLEALAGHGLLHVLLGIRSVTSP